MANLLMHPRADSLTFLFTAQSGNEGGERDERGAREEGRKINVVFSFNHAVLSCPHSCCALQDAAPKACWCFVQTVEQNGGGGHSGGH